MSTPRRRKAPRSLEPLEAKYVQDRARVLEKLDVLQLSGQPGQLVVFLEPFRVTNIRVSMDEPRSE